MFKKLINTLNVNHIFAEILFYHCPVPLPYSIHTQYYIYNTCCSAAAQLLNTVLSLLTGSGAHDVINKDHCSSLNIKIIKT